MKRVLIFIERLNKALAENLLISLYRRKEGYFSRDDKAKFKFAHLVTFLIWYCQLSAQAAINKYIREKGLDFTLQKQSLFEAREKLSHRIFIDLNEEWFLKDTVYSGSFKTWKGFRVIACDGSVFDVPPNATYFGRLKTAGEDVPKAQVVGFTDVLNDFIIKADIKPYAMYEGDMAAEMLLDFHNAPNTEDIFLFDRGFFSRSLARQLVKSNQKFLFRISSNSLKELNESNENDQIIVRKDKNKDDLTLRVINFPLPSGEMEKLATNIFDESITPKDFYNLYNLRWEVETSFLMLKDRLQIEDFSSSITELILQDFFAAILLYNLTVAEIQDATEEDTKSGIRKKYEHSPNKNIAFSQLRNLLIDAIATENPQKLSLLLSKIRQNILNSTVPKRPNRPTSSRKRKYKSVKHPINRKRSF